MSRTNDRPGLVLDVLEDEKSGQPKNARGKWAMNKSEALTDREQKLIIALVKMVDQYLDEHGDQVDSRAMSAGEHAIEALASVGLMQNVNTRFERWTAAGNQFREEFNSLRGLASAEKSSGTQLVGRPKPEG